MPSSMLGNEDIKIKDYGLTLREVSTEAEAKKKADNYKASDEY